MKGASESPDVEMHHASASQHHQKDHIIKKLKYLFIYFKMTQINLGYFYYLLDGTFFYFYTPLLLLL